MVGRKSQSGSENQCLDVWPSNYDGQDRLSQPHLSRLHQWGVFDVRRHAFGIICIIFRASALTMLLFTHTSVGVGEASALREEPAAAKPIVFVANSALLSSAPFFLEFFQAFQTFGQFLAETFRNVTRSRLLICPTLHHALVHASNRSLGDFQMFYQL